MKGKIYRTTVCGRHIERKLHWNEKDLEHLKMENIK